MFAPIGKRNKRRRKAFTRK